MKQKTVLHNLLLSLGAILCSLLIAAGVIRGIQRFDRRCIWI